MTFKDYNNGISHSNNIYNTDLDISNKKITGLDGMFNGVIGSFNCSHNKLTSLLNGPNQVTKEYNCSNNKLTSLEGAPKIVGTIFRCDNNPNLTNPKNKICELQIKAVQYITDSGIFTFDDIKYTFNEYSKLNSVKSKGFRTLLGLDK